MSIVQVYSSTHQTHPMNHRCLQIRDNIWDFVTAFLEALSYQFPFWCRSVCRHAGPYKQCSIHVYFSARLVMSIILLLFPVPVSNKIGILIPCEKWSKMKKISVSKILNHFHSRGLLHTYSIQLFCYLFPPMSSAAHALQLFQ